MKEIMKTYKSTKDANMAAHDQKVQPIPACTDDTANNFEYGHPIVAEP